MGSRVLLKSIEYLSHVITKDGIELIPFKVEAIVNSPPPTNGQQLRSFLGLINYYGKFIPNLSTLLRLLNSLIQSNKKWVGQLSVQRLFKRPINN